MLSDLSGVPTSLGSVSTVDVGLSQVEAEITIVRRKFVLVGLAVDGRGRLAILNCSAVYVSRLDRSSHFPSTYFASKPKPSSA